ncbi:MAG: copper resistance protein NlpE N-terminal domain-containing protein, partial [Lachnospiraceae bacterium]|nr:copper resistance protein NlpE N-terminal domain-containing protein [Lachnospiraceae bacterium]
MDVILQVCIGALPLLLGVAVYMIAKRKMLLPSILLGVEIICCVVTGIVFSGSKAVPITELEAVDVYASYLALEEGDSNAATEIIAKAFAKAGDKAEITLAQARVYASQGSWEKAIALYQKVSAIDKSLISGEEARLVSDIVAGDIMTASQLAYYTSNVNYLTSLGLNPVEYGFQVLSQSRVDANIKRLDQFQQTVVSQIVDDELKELEDKYPIVNDIEKIDKAVEMTMSYSYNTYNGVSYEADDGTWTSGGDAATADKTGLQKIKALASRLEKYKEKYPDLFAEKKYMEAYIYAQAIAGEDLDNVWKKGTAAENEVVANMYISGIITEENFSKEFTKEYKKVFKEVLDQCKKVAKKIHKDEDITEVYQGTLPAADGPGIDYILTLNEEINGKDTLFTLDMIYLDAKGAGKNMSFSTKGKQQKIHKVVNNHPKKAVKLTPNTGEAPIYFLVVNDTTLRMVNDSLMEVTTDTSYDIVR